MAKPGSLSATGGGRTGSFKTPFPKNYLPLLFDRLVVHWRISHKITKPLRIYQDGINKYAPSDRVPKYTKTNKMEGRNKTIQIIIGFQYFIFKNGLNNQTLDKETEDLHPTFHIYYSYLFTYMFLFICAKMQEETKN